MTGETLFETLFWFTRAPGLTSGLQGVRECPPCCSIVGATVTVHQFFVYFTCGQHVKCRGQTAGDGTLSKFYGRLRLIRSV